MSGQIGRNRAQKTQKFVETGTAASGIPVWFRQCRPPACWRSLGASKLAAYGIRRLHPQTGKPCWGGAHLPVGQQNKNGSQSGPPFQKKQGRGLFFRR
jgi:hypothetical protein